MVRLTILMVIFFLNQQMVYRWEGLCTFEKAVLYNLGAFLWINMLIVLIGYAFVVFGQLKKHILRVQESHYINYRFEYVIELLFYSTAFTFVVGLVYINVDKYLLSDFGIRSLWILLVEFISICAFTIALMCEKRMRTNKCRTMAMQDDYEGHEYNELNRNSICLKPY